MKAEAPHSSSPSVGMRGVGERLVKLSGAFYDRIRHRAALTAARTAPTAHDFDALRGHKYCLLVTFRRSGEPVPTAVWFGLDADGRLYVRTGADAGKVKRIRATPRALVAPASARGKPTGPLASASARVLPPQENARAERALKANYGLGRRLYEGVVGSALGAEAVYLEITAADEPQAAEGASVP